MTNILLSNQEKAYFDAAKAVSLLSNHKQKLGCVIIYKHHIISSGYNSKSKTHKLQAELDQKHFNSDKCLGPIHAEVSALLPLLHKKYNTNLKRAVVYVYRERSDGSLGLAKPCSRCMEVIKSCGIKKLKYTTYDGYCTEKLVY